MTSLTPTTLKFTQLRILTTTFPDSFTFYSKILNLRLKTGSPTGPYACFTLPNSTDIALFDRSLMSHAVSDAGIMNGDNTGMVVVLKVESVDNVFEELKVMKGVEIVAGPTKRTEWGLRSVHVRAPEGTLVEFAEY
ncbi:hypothetical protein HK104_005523 [Borealophlyctis nickersoniae]|nr:hypothetical protein HK104_005523 [Borealophlyctis nickersoniae]